MTKYKEFNDYRDEYDEEYKDLNWSSRHSLYQDSKVLAPVVYYDNVHIIVNEPVSFR